MANDSQINPPSKDPRSSNYSWDEPILFAGVVIFCSVFVFLFVLCCICAVVRRRTYMDLPLRRQGSSWLRRISSSRQGLSRRRNRGLDAQIIQALPTFVYTSQTSKDGPLECPVCLSEFQDGEKGRLLPNCKHKFHTECIDMWLHSHSNCPLCRTFVQPEARVENIEQGGGRGGGINIAFEQGQSSYGELEDASTSEISIDMSAIRANSFNSSARQRESEEKKYPDEAQSSQFSRLHSLKRMLSSKGREGKVFPDTLESDEAAIEKQGQSQLQS